MENKYPIFCKHRESTLVVRFSSSYEGICVVEGNGSKIGKYSTSWTYHEDNLVWEKLKFPVSKRRIGTTEIIEFDGITSGMVTQVGLNGWYYSNTLDPCTDETIWEKVDNNSPKKLWFSFKPNIVSEVPFNFVKENRIETITIDGVLIDFAGNITNFERNVPYMVLLFLNKGNDLEKQKVYEIEIQ